MAEPLFWISLGGALTLAFEHLVLPRVVEIVVFRLRRGG